MMRLRTTNLDAFNYHRSGRSSFEEFASTIRGEWHGSRPAMFGTLFHECLEKIINDANQLEAYEVPSVLLSRYDDEVLNSKVQYEFSDKVDLNLPLLGAKTEVAGELVYDDIGVTLTGHADVVYGPHLYDFKTSQAYCNESTIRRWNNSMQWRSYLLMNGGDTFTYVHFHIKVLGGGKEDVIRIRINSAESYTLHKYDGMEDDLKSAIVKLRDFIRTHGIL